MAETGDDEGILRRFGALARRLTEVELKLDVWAAAQALSLQVDSLEAEQSWRDCSRAEAARERIRLMAEVARALGDVVAEATIPQGRRDSNWRSLAVWLSTTATDIEIDIATRLLACVAGLS